MSSLPLDHLFHPPPLAVRRLLVIDGCNIARSSCGTNRENVNCAGLMATIRWLVRRDFDVVAFLPVIYNNNYNFNTSHVHILPKLESLGVITFTPARTARGHRRAFINYDDLYVAGLAERHGGSVLSGDRFKDIIQQPAYSEFHRVLSERRIDVMYTALSHEFVHCGEDRFYKCVPRLYCREPEHVRTLVIRNALFACPADPDYQKIVLRRNSWSADRRAQILSAIDELMDELSERTGVRPVEMQPDLLGETSESAPRRVPRGVFPLGSRNGEEAARRWVSPMCDPSSDYSIRSVQLYSSHSELSLLDGGPLSDAPTPASPPSGDEVLLSLSAIFPRSLVERVLRENVSRNVHVLANICAATGEPEPT